MKIVLTAFALLALIGCRKSDLTVDPSRKEDAVHAPTALVAIIADPVRFHGKTVSVTGFYRHGFEVSGLFPSRDMSFSEANGLWLDSEKETVVEPPLSDPIWQEGKLLWVQVEGSVDASSHGHLGAWTGTIRARKIKAYPADWLDERTK